MDYYAGRLTIKKPPVIKSQVDVDRYMEQVVSQFNPDDPELMKMPQLCFGNPVKERLDSDYKYDLLEMKHELDTQYQEQKSIERGNVLVVDKKQQSRPTSQVATGRNTPIGQGETSIQETSN